jgi:excisionase family DNA binding protein
MEKLLKPEEVAEMLGIQLSTVYNWTYKGKRGYQKIPFIKVGACLRFRQSDIEKWLSPTEREAEPKEPERPKTKTPKTGHQKKKKDVYIDSIVEKAKREVLDHDTI